jgi:hypothetical protein
MKNLVNVIQKVVWYHTRDSMICMIRVIDALFYPIYLDDVYYLVPGTRI